MYRTAFTILALLALAACSSAAGKPKAPTTHTIVYRLTGSAETADITYSAADGTTEQQSSVSVPLQTESGGNGFTLHGIPAGQAVYFSAQNNTDSGDLTCRILEDGRVLTEHTSTGAYTIVTCQAVA